jgi:cholesterol transport system auxiliary component
MNRRLALTASGLMCLAATSFSGCALTSKADAQSPRFFSPELLPASATPRPDAPMLRLRLGTIDAASHLEERMAYRIDQNELGYYDDRRWTEAPEQYLRRALERELFEQRGVRRVLSGPGAALDVELTAFEEIRSAPERVRLALSYQLHDERESLAVQSVVVEVALPAARGRDPERAPRVAAALASALAAAVAKVSDQIIGALAQPKAPDPQP